MHVIHIGFLHSILIGFHICLLLSREVDILVLIRLAFLFSVIKGNAPVSSRISGAVPSAACTPMEMQDNAIPAAARAMVIFFISIYSFPAANELAVYAIILL